MPVYLVSLTASGHYPFSVNKCSVRNIVKSKSLDETDVSISGDGQMTETQSAIQKKKKIKELNAFPTIIQLFLFKFINTVIY